ncbi:MAG: biopolymer transporter ExbD [Chitinispirillales bacterium]|jgi:biopolymer transport protein ExbD|nr:biopolymer transporter ExbD [Chitinispirillales bacterium]
MKKRHVWGQNSKIEANIDIDVKPVMNMFVILIPFLVSMAVFSHIAIHQFYLPPDAANSDKTGKVELKSTVVIDTNYLLVTVGSDMIDSLPIVDFDKERLINSLINAKEISNDKEKAVVSVKDAVTFDWVVKIMDICKESGFLQTGLSSAPNSADIAGKI